MVVLLHFGGGSSVVWYFLVSCTGNNMQKDEHLEKNFHFSFHRTLEVPSKEGIYS